MLRGAEERCRSRLDLSPLPGIAQIARSKRRQRSILVNERTGKENVTWRARCDWTYNAAKGGLK
jgi:hypothetical protein